MREIKFRAWDKKEEEMYYQGQYLPYEGCDSIFIGVTENRMLTEDRCEFSKEESISMKKINISDHEVVLMQYTGLKDKNGKKIYEGDIVNCKLRYEEDDKYRKTVVEWNKYNWNPFFQDYEGVYSIDSELAEIIGNIYENTELLNNLVRSIF